MNRSHSCVIFLFLAFIFSTTAHGQTSIEVTDVGIRTLSGLIDLDEMLDGTIALTQKEGKISTADLSNPGMAPVPFLDITDRVVIQGGEQGLLGVAFHPNYESNGYFYINYTGTNGISIVSRFSVDPDDPSKALPDSEKVLLDVFQPFRNHNGGDFEIWTGWISVSRIWGWWQWEETLWIMVRRGPLF